MANNVIGGGPNLHIAKLNRSFADAGITISNVIIIYKVLPGQGYISYIPGRGINGITGFQENSGYLIYAITSMDLSDTLALPFPECDDTGTAPAITVQPIDRTLTEGATLTLSVTATGTDPLSYQWRKDGANISGATGSTYTKTSVMGDAGVYDVLVSNAFGSLYSNLITVTVNASSGDLTATLKYKGTHTPGDYTGATTLRSATYPAGGTLVISFAGLPQEQFWWIEYPATDADFTINNTGGLNTDSPIPDANFDKATTGGVKRVFTKGLLSVQSTNDLTLKH